jgi:uncharacterized protein (TIGR04255 family)
MEAKQYKNPPINEALIDLRLQSSQWDWTVPGRVWDQLRTTYDGTADSVPGLSVGAQQNQNNINFNMNGGVGRLFLRNKERTKHLSLSPDGLSIHRTAPYAGWDCLINDVKQVIPCYTEIVPDSKVEHIIVRYINHITIPFNPPDPDEENVQKINMQDWFTQPPFAFEFDKTPVQSTVSQTVFVLDSHTKGVIVIASPGRSDSKSMLWILDIRVEYRPETPINLNDEFYEQAERLHGLEGRIFEEIITDELRRQFNAEQ